MAAHHARLVELLKVTHDLRNLINIEDPEDRYVEALNVIVRLQDNVDSSLRQLLAFKENWINQEMLSYRIEHWMDNAERELSTLDDSMVNNMRQFWVCSITYSFD